MKNKTTAGLLALFLGGLGVHRFYLGQTKWGILYVLFCWTYIPMVLSLIDAFLFFSNNTDAFDRKYNPDSFRPEPSPQYQSSYNPVLSVTMNGKTLQVESSPRLSEKERMVEWASNVLANKADYVILDTETTGLKANDVIIQIAIIDLDGNTLLDTLVKPQKRKSMSAEVTEIHGISFKDLKNAPTLADIAQKIEDITLNKTVLIYNAEYDERLLEQSCEQDSIDTFFFRTECVMGKYSEYVGQWNSYYGNYRWQKLPSGNHTAIGDCLATLKVIEKMSDEKKRETTTVLRTP